MGQSILDEEWTGFWWQEEQLWLGSKGGSF